MAKCELTETCIFFNDRMASMPSTANLLKKVYCEGGFDTCGRHMVFKAIGRENVPNDLFPNHCDRAITVIEKHSQR